MTLPAPHPDRTCLVTGASSGIGAEIARLLAGRGLGWDSVVKTMVFLTDMADYIMFNEIYVEALGDHRPARSLVAVAGLPLGAVVEIEVWAYAPVGGG